MDKYEAEAEIVRLVKDIDGIRESNSTSDVKLAAIASIDATIRDLKKITGPRKITGTMRI